MSGQRPPAIGFIIDGWNGEHLIVGATKPGSPAAKAGFRPHDVVMSIDDVLPMEFIERPLREKLARVEALRDGCDIALHLEFDNVAPAAPPSPSTAGDPFRSMFTNTAEAAAPAADADKVAVLAQRVAELRRKVGDLASMPPKPMQAPAGSSPSGGEWPRHRYAVGPLPSDRRAYDNGPASQAYFERQERAPPPMGHMQQWRWLDTQD